MSEAATRGVRDMYDRDADAYAELRVNLLRPAGARALAGLDLTDASVVLDVACGTGTTLDEISRGSGARVIGVDLSGAMLRHAGGRHSVVQADAAALPFAGGVADALLCCFALMHLPDPARGVAEFARVVRPGGSIAVATWGAERPWPARAAVLKILDDLGAPPVASSHHGGAATDTEGKLAVLLRAAGFDAIRTSRSRLDDAEPAADIPTTLRAWASMGSTAARLRGLDERARVTFFDRARAIMAGSTPSALAEPREVIYAWGRRAR
jgi:SAM-dependent methyltransferase